MLLCSFNPLSFEEPFLRSMAYKFGETKLLNASGYLERLNFSLDKRITRLHSMSIFIVLFFLRGVDVLAWLARNMCKGSLEFFELLLKDLIFWFVYIL